MTEGLVDAHCHPTESKDTLDQVQTMRTGTLLTMATSFDDMGTVAQLADRHPNKVVPAFGLHPWFSHHVYFNEPGFEQVITPAPSQEFIDKSLQYFEQRHIDELLQQMREYLERYPHAIVGELGLDRGFLLPNKNPEPGVNNLSQYKVSFEHQVEVFKCQLRLAVELHRPVSIHSVQCHQVMFDTLNDMNPPPPSICMHSFTGAAEMARNYLVKPKRRKLKLNAFISFSALINMNKNDGGDPLLEITPSDKILTESDFNSAGEQMDKLVQQSFDRICKHYEWNEDEGKKNIARNLDMFLLKDSN